MHDSTDAKGPVPVGPAPLVWPPDLSSLSRPEQLDLLETLQEALYPKRAKGARVQTLGSEALAASEQRYRRLFESAKDGILILDAETGKIVDVNPFLIDLLGYSKEDILQKYVWDLGALHDIIGNKENFLELCRSEYIRYDDKALKTRDGERIPVEFVSNVYLVDHRRVIQCNIRDMTEATRARVALESSKRLTDEIINALPVRVFWKDRNLVYLGCNTAFAHDADVDAPADLIGKTDHEMVWRVRADQYRADDLQVMESGQPRYLIEEPLTKADGSVIPVLTSKVPLRDADGGVTGMVGVYVDISELKRAQASEQRLAMAVRHAADAIVITDASGVIQDVNPAFEKTSGYSREEVLGRKHNILKSGKQDAEFYRQMWGTLNSGRVWQGRLTNKRKDGALYEVDETISPMRDTSGTIVSFVAVTRDVTEQERVAALLRRAQRMESIGTMAGGVAHDLNNALAPILMTTELLRTEFPDSATDDLDAISAGAQRGADLVKQLLLFARGAEGARVPMKLEPLLHELESLIQSTFPKLVELRLDVPRDLPSVLGDATQLHQVLLNLAVNARDAMPDGGKLVVEARAPDITASFETETLDVEPGTFVVLRVTDSGTGMRPEILERIFDPFYTTKPAGTGLGLATTRAILKGHRGFIRAYSSEGQGAAFHVYLPAYIQGDDVAPQVPSLPVTFRGHGETILVVDDEAAVRDVLRKVLTAMHFTVLTAADSSSAMRAVSEHPFGLAVVITDLHMPQSDGLSLVRLLRKQLPDVSVIVVSGLLGEEARDEFVQLGVKAFLDKPFTQAQLTAVLQKVLVS